MVGLEVMTLKNRVKTKNNLWPSAPLKEIFGPRDILLKYTKYKETIYLNIQNIKYIKIIRMPKVTNPTKIMFILVLIYYAKMVP